MATLTGQNIANTYKQLLQIGSDNAGLTTSVQTIQDGSGTNSALQLSQSAVNINGTFQLNGTTLTATASALNAVPDITAYTGFIAVSGTNINGRTLVAGTGVSITNADGTEGNPNIFLNTTGVTSGTYGPATNFEVNAVGQVVSAGAATSVSVSAVTANTFVGGTFEGTTGDFSSNVSVGGNLIISGAFSPAIVSTSAVNATTGTFSSTVSAGFFYGDGSNLTNVPSAEGGTVKRIEAGQGIRITVDGAVSASIPVSGTVAVSANQNFGTVSVSTAIAVTGSAKFGIVSATNVDTDELLIAGVSAANVTEVAVVSALTQVNLDSITSINAIIGDGGNYATSAELAAVSAALATSIGNSNTNITANANAITSINTVVANVSALTSVNAAAITSINAVIEGNVSADSGTFNTLTVITSASVGGTLNVGGNVGIGTSSISSATKLEVYGNSAAAHVGIRANNAAADGYATLWLSNAGDNTGIIRGGASAAAFANQLAMLTGSAMPITFSPNNTEAMRIDSSGNVGIGVTSPDTTLHVQTSDASATGIGDLVVENANNAGINILSGTVYDAAIYFGDGGSANIGRLVYNNTSNNMQFWTNGSEAMRINSSGNVGIGTSSVATNLHVYENTANGTINNIALLDAGNQNPSVSGSGVSLDFRSNSGTTYFGGVGGYSDGTNYVAGLWGGAAASGAPDLAVTSSGNVGIGGSDTQLFNGVGGSMKLVVIGDDSTTTVANNSDAGIAIVNTNQTAGNLAGLHFARADTDNSPNYAGASIVAQFPDAQVTGQYPKGELAFLTSTATNSAPSEKMRIDSSGNVGIGTASPSQKLEVAGNILATGGSISIGTGGLYQAGSIYADASWGMILRSKTASGGGQAAEFMFASSTGTERMRITSSGNVGIGTTSPDFLLDVAGRIGILEGTNGIAFHDGAGSVSAGVRADSGDNLIFATGSSDTERMRITSGGNVGIGETPGGYYKLQANGNIGGPNAAFAIYPSPGVSAKRTLSLSNNANATLHLDHDGGYNRFGCDNTSQHFAFTAGGSTAGDINVVFKGDGNVGIGTTSPAKQFEITKASRALIGTLTDGATITPDFDANQNFTVTLGGNRTLANPTNVDAGQTGSIFVVQDGTGGRTLSFGSYWKFAGGTAPTLSTGANAVDRIDYIVKSATEIHAVATLNLS